MLRYAWKNADGEEKEVENVLTAEISADADIPADEIVLTMPYDENLKAACKIFAYDGEKLVFSGIADEILSVISDDGAIMKLSGRSLAGLLLDNEARPVTYVNPAARLIFDKHLAPFGIESFEGVESPYYGKLVIEKGMSHWQVLEKFCAARYESFPRITGDGRVFMNGKTDGENTLVFGDDVQYTELREDVLPCKIISEARLRLNEYGGYTSTLKNSAAESGLPRVRYVNACGNGARLKKADKILEAGVKNSLKITVKCPERINAEVGGGAALKDKILGERDGLVIKSLKYSLDRNGESTTAVLGKE